MTAHAALRARRGASFLVWGWAMLLVVALSAAPTGGQMRSRAIGSAFDPATLSVALSPRPAKARVAKAAGNRLQAYGATVLPPGVVEEAILHSRGPAWLAPAPGAAPVPPPVLAAGPSPKALGARAPPPA